MNKRIKLISAAVGILAIGAAVAVVFQWQKGQGNQVDTVRIGAFSSGIDYAPYYVAKKKGWFEEALKEEGVGVEYTTFQSLAPINESFSTRRIDIVFEAEIPAIIGRAAGADVRIAAMLSAVKADEIVVPKSSGVNTIADLKGKKIAVLSGTGYHYALLKSLEKHGLTRHDVTIVNMTPPDAKAAFDTGSIDAWSVWPHWPEQEVFEGKGRLVKGLNARVQVVTAVRGEFAEKHPKLLSKVLAVLEKAKQWVEKNPAEAQEITSKEIDLRPEIVKMAWPKEVWDTTLTSEVIDDIQAKAEFLKAEELIQKTLDVRKDLILERAAKASSRALPLEVAPARIAAPMHWFSHGRRRIALTVQRIGAG